MFEEEIYKHINQALEVIHEGYKVRGLSIDKDRKNADFNLVHEVNTFEDVEKIVGTGSFKIETPVLSLFITHPQGDHKKRSCTTYKVHLAYSKDLKSVYPILREERTYFNQISEL